MKRLATKKLTAVAMLTAAALLIYILEAQVPPPVAIPGVKLGLANIITLVAVFLLGRREALLILLLRVFLGSIFTGQAVSFLYSLAGGLCCYGVICLLAPLWGEKRIWALSVCGALAHNTGQLAVAALLTTLGAVFWYLPVLMISGVISGAFTGLAAQYTLPRLRSIKSRNR
ncbi:MAG: Gx transporter family protein [Bacillota bacterium]|nr:Gx transporter family protein [Bacillota bacterium]